MVHTPKQSLYYSVSVGMEEYCRRLFYEFDDVQREFALHRPKGSVTAFDLFAQTVMRYVIQLLSPTFDVLLFLEGGCVLGSRWR